MDTLDAPRRALILGHFGAACHRHSRLHRTIQDDRALGSLVGLAIGDAVGAPLEFLDAVDERGTEFACRRDGELQYELLAASFANQLNLKPGQWTDDTSMALCLADSLLMAGARRLLQSQGEEDGDRNRRVVKLFSREDQDELAKFDEAAERANAKQQLQEEAERYRGDDHAADEGIRTDQSI